MRDRLKEINYSRFNVYTPVLKYDHLTPERIEWLLAKCFRRYYFRWQYLRENASLLWPGLRRWGYGAKPGCPPIAETIRGSVPKPRSARHVFQNKGLRTDGPHRPGYLTEPHGE